MIGYITSTTVENNLESARDQLESAERSRDDAYNQLEQLVIQNDTYSLDSNIQSAQISLDNARISPERAQENLEDYEITAPIEGTIIEKNKKAGDKLDITVYRMSAGKFIDLTITLTDQHDLSDDSTATQSETGQGQGENGYSQYDQNPFYYFFGR